MKRKNISRTIFFLCSTLLDYSQLIVCWLFNARQKQQFFRCWRALKKSEALLVFARSSHNFLKSRKNRSNFALSDDVGYDTESISTLEAELCSVKLILPEGQRRREWSHFRIQAVQVSRRWCALVCIRYECTGQPTADVSVNNRTTDDDVELKQLGVGLRSTIAASATSTIVFSLSDTRKSSTIVEIFHLLATTKPEQDSVVW